MKKNWQLPAVAVFGGAVGFGLRKWQLATAFETGTGLVIKGAPATVALMAWCGAMAAMLVALCWNRKGPRTCERAFAARGNSVFLTACVLSGFLLLISAGSEAITLMAGYRSSLYTDQSWTAQVSNKFLPPLQAALCLGGFPCVLLWTRRLAQEEAGRKESLALLELCLLFCLWLISDYQNRAADPVVQNYLYEILAISAGVMALYYLAGYSFQTGHPRRTVVSCLLAVVFSMIAMADRHELSDYLRFGFAVLFMTAHAALILKGKNENEIELEPTQTEDVSVQEHHKEAEENV